MLPDRVRKPVEHRCEAWVVDGAAALNRIQCIAVVVKAGKPHHGRGVALVGNVVCAASERVNSLNRLTQSCWEQEGRNRKVFVMVYGHREGLWAAYLAGMTRAEYKRRRAAGTFPAGDSLVPMLKISQLTKILPTTPPRKLFDALSLDVAAGECVAIIGESGVGKSTLLNCVAGLEPVSDGSISVAGTELAGMGDDALAMLRRNCFGFVFQAFHVLPHLSLLHNVAVPLWLQGIDVQEADRQAAEMLARVGLGNRANDWPRNLSGGEMQRVAIARALVHRPSVVLADEPTGNLDPARAADVLELLLVSVRTAGAAGVLVTHSRSAAQRADRIFELREDGLIQVMASDA